MFKRFLCGKFHNHQEDNDIENLSTPKKPKRKLLSKTRNGKNPYADLGLDKFSALLADLEEEKNKIYTQVGSENISLVRFVFSNSNERKPIVVTSKKKKQTISETKDKQINSKPVDKQITDNEASILANDEDQCKVEPKRILKKNLSWNLTWENWRKSHYYLLVTIILILVLLAIFGRSFAVLCTSIGWYLAPSDQRDLKVKYNFKNTEKEWGI